MSRAKDEKEGVVRIVVTGAAGFIGSHLCERLESLGHDVVGVDSFNGYYPLSMKERNARILSDRGLKVERLDLAQDCLDSCLDGAQVVFHLAAQPGISANVPFSAYIQNNLVATSMLLRACTARKSPPFIVNVSTSSVYGCHATAPESAPTKPTSYYGMTKLAAEQLALEYCHQGKLQSCSIRLFSVYGPRERSDKLYTKLILSILKGEEFLLHDGSLQHKRSYTFVEDSVAGFVAVLDHLQSCAGQIFNIGTDIDVSTEEGINIIERLLDKKARMRIVPPRLGDQVHTRANIKKARAMLGFAPKTTLEEGLKMQVDWLRSFLSDTDVT